MNHTILSAKLKQLPLNPYIINWYQSFLHARKNIIIVLLEKKKLMGGGGGFKTKFGNGSYLTGNRAYLKVRGSYLEGNESYFEGNESSL